MKKFIIGASSGALALALLAGCGHTSSTSNASSNTSTSASSGTSNGSSDVPAAVTALLAQGSQAQPWAGPTTSPKVAPHKFIVSIPCGLAAAGCALIDSGVHDAAKVMGWKVLTIDPNFDPGRTNAAIMQAISLHANAIVLGAVDPELVVDAIASARKAGIVVVDTNNGFGTAPITADGVQHTVDINGPLEGRWAAAALCAGMSGKANVLILEDPAYPLLVQRAQGALTYLKQNCPGVTAQVKVQSATDPTATLQSKLASLLEGLPNVNAIIGTGDPYELNLPAVLTQIGKSHAIRLYGTDGEALIIASVRNGGPFYATQGQALLQVGYAALDDVNRIMAGETLPNNYTFDGIQQRLITQQFAKTLTGAYNGDVNWAAIYNQLWTTGKATS